MANAASGDGNPVQILADLGVNQTLSALIAVLLTLFVDLRLDLLDAHDSRSFRNPPALRGPCPVVKKIVDLFSSSNHPRCESSDGEERGECCDETLQVYEEAHPMFH